MQIYHQYLRLILLPLWLIPIGVSAQVPVAYAGPDQDFCAGDTVQLQGTGSNAGPLYSYQWTPATWLSDPTLPNPVAWPPTPTIYSLVVTSNAISSPPDQINLNPHVIPTVDAGPDLAICLGDTAQLDGTASGEPLAVYTYTWSPNHWLSDSTQEDPRANPLQTTIYYFSAVSIWACPSAIDSATVTIRPTAFAEAGPNKIACLGDTVSLDGNYAWFTPDTLAPAQVSHFWTPTAHVQNPNDYVTSVLVDSTQWYYLEVNAGPCRSIDSVFIVGIQAPSLTVQRNGNTLTAIGGLGGATLQWFKDGVAIPNAMSANYTVSQTGCYAALILEGGCSTLSDTICYTSVGLQSPYLLQQVKVFPNPFAENIFVAFELIKGEWLSFGLSNLLGKTVWYSDRKHYHFGKNKLVFNLENIPHGAYFLKIESASKQLILPLMH